MPFSKRAIEELEKRLRDNERKIGTGFTTDELQETARLLTGLIASSLKMRQRFRAVGRPLKRKEKNAERLRQGVFPGFEVDRRERIGSKMAS
jgi:hypothetical protein